MTKQTTSHLFGMENVIILTPEEKARALRIGAERRRQNKVASTNQKRGAETRDLKYIDALGACGEQAVAKYLGTEWDGNLGDWTAPDVGPYEVRTRGRHWYQLALYPDTGDVEKGHKPYILVTCEDPDMLQFHIRGWTWGDDAMNDRFWRKPQSDRWTGGHCWLLHACELSPMRIFPMDNGNFDEPGLLAYLHGGVLAKR